MNKEKKKVSQKDVAILVLWDDGVWPRLGLRYGSDYEVPIDSSILYSSTSATTPRLKKRGASPPSANQFVNILSNYAQSRLCDTSKKT
jgi:hypothetical protein